LITLIQYEVFGPDLWQAKASIFCPLDDAELDQRFELSENHGPIASEGARQVRDGESVAGVGIDVGQRLEERAMSFAADVWCVSVTSGE